MNGIEFYIKNKVLFAFCVLFGSLFAFVMLVLPFSLEKIQNAILTPTDL